MSNEPTGPGGSTGSGFEVGSAIAGAATPPVFAEASASAPAPEDRSAGKPAAETALRYAGFWRRFLAFLLDFIVTSLIGFAANSVMRVSAGLSTTPVWDYPPGASFLYKILESLVGIVIYWVYFAALESSTQQATLGKMAIGIRVTDINGRRISFGRATGRHFGKIVSAILLLVGFVMAAFTRRKQALHDLMAGTLVVKG